MPWHASSLHPTRGARAPRGRRRSASRGPGKRARPRSYASSRRRPLLMSPDARDMDPCVSVVIGLGEVGRPLLTVLERVRRVEGVDLPARDVAGPVDLLHVCYPAEIADFVGITAGYVTRHRPPIVVIHSTVPVGSTRAVPAGGPVPLVRSPVRGED